MSRAVVSLDEKQRWMRERHSAPRAADAPSENGCSAPTFAQRHFTVREIAELWHLSDDAVRRLFEGEPGVLTLGGNGNARGARRYLTLRVPEGVAERAWRRNLSR